MFDFYLTYYKEMNQSQFSLGINSNIFMMILILI